MAVKTIRRVAGRPVKTRPWTAEDFAAFNEAMAQLSAEIKTGKLEKKAKTEAEIIASERRREHRAEMRHSRRTER